MEHLKSRKEKGITLMVLVITIVVLLILASVTIAGLIGDKGIIKEARDAKEQTEIKSLEEQIDISIIQAEAKNDPTTIDNVIEELIKNEIITNSSQVDRQTGKIETNLGYAIEGKLNDYLGIENLPEDDTKPGNPDKQTGIFLESSTINGGEANSNNPVIPAGFKPLDTTTSSWKNEAQSPTQESVNEGLVIQDKEGNQFVWVPVPNTNEDYFKRVEGYRNDSRQTTYLPSCSEPYSDSSNEEKVEYDNMKKSVEKYQGFYIGRYEGGKDSNNQLVVQKNKPVYNNIGWSNSDDMKNQTGGAVQISREFKNGKDWANSATSTLIYGVQWDATMQFFDNKYLTEECEKTSYVRNSTNKGNYQDEDSDNNPASTGSKDSYAVKNIYDMAGNVFEWTMEAYTTSRRIIRGGYYDNIATNTPASERSSALPSYIQVDVGLRIALYINI